MHDSQYTRLLRLRFSKGPRCGDGGQQLQRYELLASTVAYGRLSGERGLMMLLARGMCCGHRSRTEEHSADRACGWLLQVL